MMRQYVQIALLTGIFVGGCVVGFIPLALASRDGSSPVSRGVVATITSIDDRKGMATLTTEDGEVFALPKGWYWKVGDKVECDRIDNGLRPWLQHCQPWE